MLAQYRSHMPLPFDASVEAQSPKVLFLKTYCTSRMQGGKVSILDKPPDLDLQGHVGKLLFHAQIVFNLREIQPRVSYWKIREG